MRALAYDSTIYRGYGLQQPDGTVTPFTGGGVRLPNNDYVVSFNTPSWKTFDFNGFALAGLNDENYSEWASGRIVGANVGMDVRPSDHLRLNLSYNDSRVYRPSDGSRVLLQDVVVGTVEYQLSRAFQLRVISQYSINARDSLHDDSRTNLPIVIQDGYRCIRARERLRQPRAADQFPLHLPPEPGHGHLPRVRHGRSAAGPGQSAEARTGTERFLLEAVVFVEDEGVAPRRFNRQLLRRLIE